MKISSIERKGFTLKEYKKYVPTDYDYYSFLYTQRLFDCPFCGSRDRYLRDTHSSEVWDIIEDEYNENIFTPAVIGELHTAYRCKNCFRSFVEGDYLNSPKTRMTHDFIQYFCQETVFYRTSLQQNSKKYNLSHTAFQNYIKQYIEDFDLTIISIKPCSYLYFIPYTINNVSRCFICGKEEPSSNMDLLWILPTDTDEAIAEFFDNRITFKVEKVFCPLDQRYVQILNHLFPEETNICVLRNDIMSKANKIASNKNVSDTITLNMLLNGTRKLEEILYRTGFSKGMLESWWRSLRDAQPAFQELWEQIYACQGACLNSVSLPRALDDYSELHKEVMYQKKKRTNFDLLWIQMLTANNEIRAKLKKAPQGRYMGSMSMMQNTTAKRYGLGYYNFHVRLPLSHEELQGYDVTIVRNLLSSDLKFDSRCLEE